MSISHWTRLALAGLVALLVAAPAAEAQRGGGKYSLEYEGELTGGVTGVRSTYSDGGGSFVVDLPPVVASYPTVRLVRRAGVPVRPAQIEIGGGQEAFTIEFTHPDLPVAYVAQRGTVRVTEVGDGRVAGEFAVVAAPAGGGAKTITLRGRFDAVRR